MYKNYGNIVLFEGKDWESRVVSFFTKSKYNHVAIQVRRNVTMSITRNGKSRRYLNSPGDWVDSYLILEHKEINPTNRRRMRKNNNQLTDEYDTGILLRLAFRHVIGKEPDLEDISRGGGFNCSNKPAYLYNLEGRKIMDGVHSSQIEPQHYLEGGYFEIIQEWRRKNG